MDKLLLYVENDPYSSIYLSEALKDDYRVTVVRNHSSILEHLRFHKYKALLVDLNLLNSTISELVSQVRSICPDMLILAISGMDMEDIRRICREAGIINFIQKPVKVQILREFIRKSVT